MKLLAITFKVANVCQNELRKKRVVVMPSYSSLNNSNSGEGFSLDCFLFT